jgi:hypothetical protein
MHHMAHPDRALHNIRELLPPLPARQRPRGPARPGGTLPSGGRPPLRQSGAAPPRRLANHADLGRLHRRRRAHITVNIECSHDKTVGPYALSTLQRIHHGIADILIPEDLAALDRLLDTNSPHSILGRRDLAIHTERIVWAARHTE